jgi:uncharacterized protein (TIGR01777 family)
MKRIYIAGISGFVGSALAPFLRSKGYNVIRFTGILDEPFAVINLSGESIGKGRWTKGKKGRIYQSRIETTQNIVRLLEQGEFAPPLFISASAVGYYGANAGVIKNEKGSPGGDFLAHVCYDWEKEAMGYKRGRVVIARFGVVITETGGFLKKLIEIAKWGLLGTFGSGENKTSWIAMQDLMSAMLFCIENQGICGAVNFTAPEPFSNKECVTSIAKYVHRWTFFSTPSFLLLWLFGEKGRELFLANQSVFPKKLLDNGFRFHFFSFKEFLFPVTLYRKN